MPWRLGVCVCVGLGIKAHRTVKSRRRDASISGVMAAVVEAFVSSPSSVAFDLCVGRVDQRDRPQSEVIGVI